MTTLKEARAAWPYANEEAFQRDVARLLDTVLLDPAFWFHVPNGGNRSKAEGGKLKAQGAKAGVPDCLIFWPGMVLAIELKPPGKYMSPAQRDFAQDFRCADFKHEVCHTMDEVQAALDKHRVPVKGWLQ